jgi:hypothetical protein
MNNRFRFMLAGVVMLAATSAAFAQNRMAATIGFPFRMQGVTLPAGSYELLPSTTSGSRYFILRSATKLNSVIVKTQYTIHEASPSAAHPRLVFRCGSETCALAQIWTPDGAGYAAPSSKRSPTENDRLAVVPLTTTKAD